MKRVLLLILISSSLLTCLHAQDDSSTVKTPEISLSGGVSLPYLPDHFKDYWKKGWNAGAGFGYSTNPGSIGYSTLLATVEYSRWAFDVAAFRTKLNLVQKNVALSRNPTSVFNIMFSYKGTFSPSRRSLAPYFLIGFGYLHLSEGAITCSGDTAFTVSGQSASAFAWSVGVGIEVPVTESIAFFVQGKSTLGVIDPTRQYFPLSGGFTYRLLNK
ncbi:MAG TPA: outer membrane beta-barrel protein [Bacteroidota bacterium]|jgi:opacity protein-like surface antigen